MVGAYSLYTSGPDSLKRVKRWDKFMNLVLPHSMRLDEWFDAASRLYDEYLVSEGQDAESLDSAISTLNRIIVWQAESGKTYNNASWVLHKLAEALQSRYLLHKRMDDLNGSIKWFQEAVKSPAKHGYSPVLTIRLSGLGRALQQRYEDSRGGDPSDLDQAISTFSECLRICSRNDFHYTDFLEDLAGCLKLRFNKRGEVADCDEAIRLYQSAIDLTPKNHPYLHITISNLAVALSERFERLEDPATLKKIVHLHRQAVKHSRERYDKSYLPTNLFNLATAVFNRFLVLDRLSDLDESEALCRESINASPPVDQILPNAHYQLATILLEMHGCNRASRFCPDTRSATVYHFQQAVELTHDYDRSKFLLGLGRALHDLHNEERWMEAVEAFREVATSESGSWSDRYAGAIWWGSTAGKHQRPDIALEGYTIAVRLLPHVVSLSMTNAERYDSLSRLSGTYACDAAANAIQMQQPELAVELFEQGRAVFWQQALQLRSDFSDLRDMDQDLYDELISTAKLLENNQVYTPLPLEASNSHQILTHPASSSGDPEALALRRRRLAQEWERLLGFVRKKIPHFLLPLSFTELRKVARKGPVVLVNLSMYRSDALIIMPEGGEDEPSVKTVPLPPLLKTAGEITTQIRGVVGLREKSRNSRLRPKPQSKTNQIITDPMQKTLELLWDMVVSHVVDALQLKMLPIDELPRIWWCSSGSLAAAPLHAAQSAKSGQSFQDLAVSSYVPFLRTLLQARTRARRVHPFRALAVSQPNSPGKISAPLDTTHEIQALADIIPEDQLEILEGRDATVERALSALQTVQWAHWACHGEQDENPLSSALLLHDGNLQLSHLMHSPLPDADFAFLSACETATGDRGVPNESMHLAAGMIFAGFKSVVGTLWSISDRDVPIIARTVYKGMKMNRSDEREQHDAEERPPHEDIHLNSENAARALHKAVVKLRYSEQYIQSERWVPFVHMGW